MCVCVKMAYWATHFHRSDGDEASLKHMQSMRNDIIEMQSVVGNEDTENTLVHDVEKLKEEKADESKVEDVENRSTRYTDQAIATDELHVRTDGSVSMDANLDMNEHSICNLAYDDSSLTCAVPAGWVKNEIRQSSSRLQHDIDAVRKMKGPRGDRGLGWLSGGGMPLNSVGRNGDFYLDAATLIVYKKFSSKWMAFGRLRGPRGEAGPRGERGLIGPEGETGPRGGDGQGGERGQKGDQGIPGPEGPRGKVGPRGERGLVGPEGEIGPRGEDGQDGSQGERGVQGDQGTTGPVGPQGTIGATGPPGNRGPVGPQGIVGPIGPPGARGPVGPQSNQNLSYPFHLLPLIRRNAYLYIYSHPSRFESVARVSRNRYRGINLVDLKDKRINVNSIDMFRDGHFYLNITQPSQVSIRERFVNLFHDNMSFAMFQVIQVDAPDPRNMALKAFDIDTVGNFSLDSLYVLFTATHISGNYFTRPGYSSFNIPVSSLANQLLVALDKPVSSMTDLLGTKCVISYARNSEGLFTLYVNSILIHSNLDTVPFSRTNGIEDCNYSIGGTQFFNGTSSKLFCHLHFAESLSSHTIQRIHTELMTHYDI